MSAPLKPPRDAKGQHRAACDALAGRLGFTQREVWGLWEFVAGCIEFELRGARDVRQGGRGAVVSRKAKRPGEPRRLGQPPTG